MVWGFSKRKLLLVVFLWSAKENHYNVVKQNKFMFFGSSAQDHHDNMCCVQPKLKTHITICVFLEFISRTPVLFVCFGNLPEAKPKPTITFYLISICWVEIRFALCVLCKISVAIICKLVCYVYGWTFNHEPLASLFGELMVNTCF